jgi:metal-responsive CopG/Arc/MetJ family transcriptional regulator
MKREYDFRKEKTRITIRLEEDVIARFRTQVQRAGGRHYQSLINDALRQHIANAREPLEETLRRIVREEMRGSVSAGAALQVCPLYLPG